MNFMTSIAIPSPLRLITLGSRVAFIGSCFAQNMGTRMRQSGFPALVNPFGVLYNPLSILQALAQNPTHDKLYFEDERQQWHCWLTDSSMNASSIDSCKAAVLSARGKLFAPLPDTMVITLGTNHYYDYQGLAVGNCHKQPQQWFTEHVLTTEQAVNALLQICQLFAHTQIIFTVSPYRYAKYGFHENQLSKSTLLLAIEEVMRSRPEQVCYFPAYELVLDELRDYRFYKPDMLHPSDQAVDYIWEKFAQTCLDEKSQQFLKDYEPIRKALAHKPEDPDSPEAIAFREQTHNRLNELLIKYNIEP